MEMESIKLIKMFNQPESLDLIGYSKGKVGY